MRDCIVLFCGLPGSGKTSLIKEISEKAFSQKDTHLARNSEHTQKQENHDLSNYEIHLISYDQLLPLKLQEKLVAQEEWKINRQLILRASEAYICYACQLPDADQIFQSLQPIERSHLENITIVNMSRRDTDLCENRCFLIEDNFYYRSMRYEWFQLARKYGFGFCQIYLNCKIKTAVQRNNRRPELERVPEAVIERMSDRAEKPDKESNNWENHSILIDTESDFCRDVGVIFALVEEALLHPVQQFDDKGKEKEESQQICSKNILHQADQILRKIVAKKINAVKAGACQDLRQVSKELNSIKQTISDKFRNGQINLPESLMETLQTSDLPGCQNQDFLNLITEHFESCAENVLSYVEDSVT